MWSNTYTTQQHLTSTALTSLQPVRDGMEPAQCPHPSLPMPSYFRWQQLEVLSPLHITYRDMVKRSHKLNTMVGGYSVLAPMDSAQGCSSVQQ